MREDPTKAMRQLFSDSNFSRTTVWRILNWESLYPYKPIYFKFLSDGDDDWHLQFCLEMIANFDADLAFHWKLIFSDERVFALTSSVNKHNVHYWEQKTRIFGKMPTLVVCAAIG